MMISAEPFAPESPLPAVLELRAELRLSEAEERVSTCTNQLDDAKNQFALSQKELQSVREELKKLKVESKNIKDVDISTLRASWLANSPTPIASHRALMMRVELRVSVAKEWVSTSIKELDNAITHFAISQIELENAREELEWREGGNENYHSGTNKDVNFMSSLPGGETENETASEREKSIDTSTKNGGVHSAEMHFLRNSLSGDTASETVSEATPLTPCESEETGNDSSIFVRVTSTDTYLEKIPEIPDRISISSETIEKKKIDNSYEYFLKFMDSLGCQAIDKPPKKNHLKPFIMIKESANQIKCSAIEVSGCGIRAINGRYRTFGESDGVPSYSKIEVFGGKETMFTMARWRSNNGTRKWYITAIIPGGTTPTQYVFYVAYTPSFIINPPKTSWITVSEGDELFLAPVYKGKGLDPVPRIVLESDDTNTNGAMSLGGQIARSLWSTSLARSNRGTK